MASNLKPLTAEQLGELAVSLTEYTNDKLLKLFLANGAATLLVGRESRWGQIHEVIKEEMGRRGMKENGELN